ncbi:histidine kinase [Micromonospora sp. NPDC049523]|uniref:sensor histidine kinase n=1 Tax=Micromonospora sp. NPDC049523 TaxID=3155921 RepID=UPI00343A0C6C
MDIGQWRSGRGTTAADIGLGAAFAVALVFQAVALAVSWGGHYWLFDFTAGVVVCTIALVRRRHRVRATAAGLAVAAGTILVARVAELPAEPGPAMALGLSVLVGSALRTLSVPLAGVAAATGFAVVVLSNLATAPSSSGAVAALNGIGWVAALTVGLCLRLFDAGRKATIDRVRRDERLELAREMHDVVAHHITGIVLQAQATQILARRRPDNPENSLAGIERALAGIETAGSEALTAMRRVVGVLRDTDDAAPAMPGPEHLSELVARFDGHGPPVRLRLPERTSGWPPEVTTTVYRVVQESLTNVSRHAPHARSVEVSVAQDEQAVRVEVLDDAPPAPAASPLRGGYGLVGMRERVEALGGTLYAGPRPREGWSVTATLPVAVREPR